VSAAADARDLAALLQTMWQGPPLVVMTNFGGEEHMKLAAVTFQNMFPAINVQTTKLSSCQVWRGGRLGPEAGCAPHQI
jgi:hypothetical protein